MNATSIESVIAKQNEDAKGAVAAFKRELQKVRTGRASSGLIEGIMVDYYGARTALSHMGQISTPEAKLIVIQVYDASAIPAIEKAIHNAGLGLNPSREGSIIRLNVPGLTEESRKELVRHLHKLTEDMRVSIRNHRRDANEIVKKMEKESLATKDEAKKALDKIQKQTDAAISEVDALLAQKEAECLEV